MCKPDLGRVLGDIEVNDPSAVVAEDDHGVEQAKRRGRNDEHVDSNGVAHVVAQEAAPGRGGTLGRHDMYLPTVAWLTTMPSLSSSPWIRGAPQRGLAMLIRRIRLRTSVQVLGRPG